MLIVDGATEGQVVDVEVTDVRDQYAFAKVREVVKEAMSYSDR